MVIINFIAINFKRLKPFVVEGFCAYSHYRTKPALNCLIRRINNNKKKKYDYTFY